MKSIIYRNPVISAVSINIVTLIIFIYSIRKREYWLVSGLMFVGVANRRIIDNGEKVDKKKRTIIFISFFLMVIIYLAYSIYRFKVINSQIINGM
jgi:hypothetical protein